MKLNKAKWRDVEIAGNTLATFLCYNCPKSEQRLTVKESVKHHDVLLRLGAAIQGKSNKLTLP